MPLDMLPWHVLTTYAWFLAGFVAWIMTVVQTRDEEIVSVVLVWGCAPIMLSGPVALILVMASTFLPDDDPFAEHEWN